MANINTSSFRLGWLQRLHNLRNAQRDARYVLTLLGGGLVFLLTYLQALSNGLFDSIERPVFHVINSLPHALYPLMYAVTQLGNLASLLVWCGLAWYVINKRAAYTVLSAGVAAWLGAKIVKLSVHRGRPSALLPHVHLFNGETFSGYGFPSGHATLSAACVAALYFQVAPRYRKYLLLVLLLIGISRMYLGAHFPLDVVGGWGLGTMIGSAAVLLWGMSTRNLSASRLKRLLRRRGYEAGSLTFAKVDARGSRPFFMETADGAQYFGKIFGRQEHAADWLFKLYRFFRYKNLQAEEPYVNSRRNVEFEALATLWAAQAGARVAGVVDVLQIGALWVLLQERIDGKPLAETGRLSKATLQDAWKQVQLMHAHGLAHRDLRAANLLVDRSGKVWIIDFGFAEMAAKPQRLAMDLAELLMSMALVAGVKATVTAACKVVPADRLRRALPYLQKAVFSGATAKALKADMQKLPELKDLLRERLKVDEEVKEAEIVRFSLRKTINLLLIALFIYIILPQFKLFSGTLHVLTHLRWGWAAVVVLASALTYYCTGLIYLVLADVPLKSLPTALVQLAASFVTKVIPGGLGSTTVNGRYLQKAGMDSAAVAALLLAQSAISFLSFIVPLGLFLFLSGTRLSSLFSFHVRLQYVIIVVCLIILAAAIVAAVRRWRQTVVAKITDFIANLRELTTAPRDLGMAMAASLAVTACYLVCLYAAQRALGIHLSIAATVLVYASAVIARSAVPTPGGLGPLEIAMVAAMIGFGVAKPDAVAAMVLYRLATFWLPVPFSLLAYRYLTRRQLI